MSSDPAIRLNNLGKCYHLYDKPRDRLLQMLSRGRRRYYREFWALQNVSFSLGHGECLGIIGRNGSGKSTLLQLVCGTLNPSEGSEVSVQGRVAALLELGAGFNPEFSGRENVFLNAAVLGLSPEEAAARFEDIVEFSGVRNFIDQPVKTYSSGMYVRLAFSIATSIDPDILVIDEALSVGDGEFARRSFDRIMALKEQGKTILFCSHALYQIEALCNRAIWLDGGRAVMIGDPAEVVMAYNNAMNNASAVGLHGGATPAAVTVSEGEGVSLAATVGTARIAAVKVMVDKREGIELEAQSGANEVAVQVRFAADPALAMPHVAVCIVGQDGRVVASVGTHVDHYLPHRSADGSGEVTVLFPDFALLRGEYRFDVYLLCERGVHVYDCAAMVAVLKVRQSTVELGIVTLPHVWTG